MYNLAISIGVAALAYVLGLLVAGWLAGFLPALLAGFTAYFLLARRTGKQLEARMAEAGAALNAGRLDEGRKLIEQCLELAPWQFLVKEQIHAQLGAIDYLQRRFPEARSHLEQSWKRNWMSMAMLACIDHRDGKHEAALARMEQTVGPGAKDPIFWALYAWLALEARDQDKALSAVTRGLEKNAGSKALQELADTVRNKKRVKPQKMFQPFAPGWYQFFPEHMNQAELFKAAGQEPPPRGYQYPAPRGFRR